MSDDELFITRLGPGTYLLFALIVLSLAISACATAEHAWAVPLVNDILEAGVEVALNHRIPSPIVDEAFASLA